MLASEEGGISRVASYKREFMNFLVPNETLFSTCQLGVFLVEWCMSECPQFQVKRMRLSLCNAHAHALEVYFYRIGEIVIISSFSPIDLNLTIFAVFHLPTTNML